MTDTPVQEKLISEDELMRLAAIHWRVEVVNGDVIITDLEDIDPMHPVGGLHSFVGENLHDILKPFAKANNLGFVFGDGLIYFLNKQDNGLKGSRVPDLSFVSTASLRTDWDVTRGYPGAPDLAVEIISPHDGADETEQRIADYLAAGSREVWIIYPSTEVLHRHQLNSPVIYKYTAADSFDASPLFPGLTIVMRDLFILPSQLIG